MWSGLGVIPEKSLAHSSYESGSEIGDPEPIVFNEASRNERAAVYGSTSAMKILSGSNLSYLAWRWGRGG
jgi:hypothetical protein